MEVCLTHLQEVGNKITHARKTILNTLMDASHVDVNEMAHLLKTKHQQIDLATIYRTLELFCTMGCIDKFSVGDRLMKYEYVMHKPHHHHLICEGCGMIEDTPCTTPLPDQQSVTKGFKITSHTMEFFGLCKSCQ